MAESKSLLFPDVKAINNPSSENRRRPKLVSLFISSVIQTVQKFCQNAKYHHSLGGHEQLINTYIITSSPDN